MSEADRTEQFSGNRETFERAVMEVRRLYHREKRLVELLTEYYILLKVTCLDYAPPSNLEAKRKLMETEAESLGITDQVKGDS